jgi:hypothetical protein
MPRPKPCCSGISRNKKTRARTHNRHCSASRTDVRSTANFRIADTGNPNGVVVYLPYLMGQYCGCPILRGVLSRSLWH